MKRFAIALFCSAWMIGVVAAADGQAAVKPPNFIVVASDNLGYGDIEPFGSTLHRTPQLNRMAAEGRKFTHFYVSACVCTPSRASLMTGCYAQRVGLHTNPRDGQVLRPVSPYGLSPDETTIAEVLKGQGYATACIGKWHLGDQPEFLPTRQGFDWYFGIPYSDDMTERVWDVDGSKWPPLPLMENETVVEAPCDRNTLTKRYTERAMEWIEEHKDGPFFLYLPHAMPGSTPAPFASDDFRGKSGNGPWGDSIKELDWSIGAMMDQLVKLRLAENTLLIWTSDNGAPANREPGDYKRGSNFPLQGRLGSTDEGAFRVPMIAWQPSKVPAGTVCDQLTTTMDLLPTLANLAGGSLPLDRKTDGHDIQGLLFGQPNAKSPYEAFYYYQESQLQAVRSGPWKLFMEIDPFLKHPHFGPNNPPRDMLFNVVDDPANEHDLAAERPHIVAKLNSLAEQARADLGDLGRPGAGQRPAGKIIDNATAAPQTLAANALNVIESERGGRHWADAKTMPPKSPSESLAAIQIEAGFEIQLFAAEPLVIDPVAIDFDEQGRMFVVEYSDYPIGPAEGGEPLSKIVMLEDSDHDGAADVRHVFADKLDFAHSLMAHDGGLLVGAKTKVLFLKDTDGDHVADVREVWFDGFVPGHPQMQIGNPRWGIDNWIYLNYGPGKVSSKADPDHFIEMPRQDCRFNPRTLELQPDTGLGQYGNTIDRWGHRFYCSNRNPIMTTFLSPQRIARNPFHVVTKGHYDVGDASGDTKVFPLVQMNSNYLAHAGTHTAACGTTAYTGDLSDGDLLDSVMVCEPIGHLVTRSIVNPQGLKLRAERAQPAADFIASTDTWFRPSSLANGPDGALYLADMYRLWVEHPKFLPPEIAAKLDWRAGDDRGRIYRIAPTTGPKRTPFRTPESNAAAVALLTDSNGWRQFLGQRLLVEKQAIEQSAEIRSLLIDFPQATTRLHALWTLDGLSELDSADVVAALGDENVHVQTAALQLSQSRIEDRNVRDSVLALAGSTDIRLRFGTAMALSNCDETAATEVLARLAMRDGDDAWFVEGLMTSLKDRSGEVLSRLVENDEFVADASSQRIQLIKSMAATVGARGDLKELSKLFALLAAEKPVGDWWRAAAVSGLGEGLPRHHGELGRITMVGLFARPPEPLASSAMKLKEFFTRIRAVSTDPNRSLVDRVSAVELLAYQPLGQVRAELIQLIRADQPVEIQTASIGALSSSRSTAAASIVLDHWSSLGPAVRGPGLQWMLNRPETTRLALAAIESGKMRVSSLSIDQRVVLLKHSDEEIRDTAVRLFGGVVSANRSQVAKDYEKCLTLSASAGEGAKVFARTCATCHRFDGNGHSVGPDLGDLRNRSKPTILYEILDPNSKVEPRFTAYSVLTVDGAVYNGLIDSETPESIVLNMAEGKKQSIGRAEIEQLKVNDVSLMPEGIEKDIRLQEMADLLEYLASPRR